MNNLDFQYQLTDAQFGVLVELIRADGGTIDKSIVSLEGIYAGYSYRGTLLKLHVEDTQTTRKFVGPKTEELPLLKLIQKAQLTGQLASWPPAPPVVVIAEPVVEPAPAEEPVAESHPTE